MAPEKVQLKSGAIEARQCSKAKVSGGTVKFITVWRPAGKELTTWVSVGQSSTTASYIRCHLSAIIGFHAGHGVQSLSTLIALPWGERKKGEYSTHRASSQSPGSVISSAEVRFSAYARSCQRVIGDGLKLHL